MKIESLIVEECRLYVLKALEEKYTCNTFEFSLSNYSFDRFKTTCTFNDPRMHTKIGYRFFFEEDIEKLNSSCKVSFVLWHSDSCFSIKEMQQSLHQTSKLVEVAEFIESKVHEFNTLNLEPTK